MSTHPSESDMLTVRHAVTEIHYALSRRPCQTKLGHENMKNWYNMFFAALDKAYDFQAQFKLNTWPRYTLGAFYEYEKSRHVAGYAGSPFEIVPIADTAAAQKAGYNFDLHIVGNDHGQIGLLPEQDVDLSWCDIEATVTDSQSTGDGANKSSTTKSGAAKSTEGTKSAGVPKIADATENTGSSKTTGTTKSAASPTASGATTTDVSSKTAKPAKGARKRFNPRMSRPIKKPAEPAKPARRQLTKDKKGKGRATTVEVTTDDDVSNEEEEDDESEEETPLQDVRKTRSITKKAVSFATPTTPPLSKTRRATSAAPEPPKRTTATPKKRARSQSRDVTRTAGTNSGDEDNAPSGGGSGKTTTKKPVKRVLRPAHPDHVAPEKNFDPLPDHKGRIPVYVIRKDGPMAHFRCGRCKAAGTDCRILIFDGSYCKSCRTKKMACDLSPIGHGRLGAAAYRSYRAFVQLANPARYPDPVLVSRLLLALQDSGLADWFFDWYWDFYELDLATRQKMINDPKYHIDLHVAEWRTPIRRIAGDVEVMPNSEDYPKPRRGRKSNTDKDTVPRQKSNEIDEDDASDGEHDDEKMTEAEGGYHSSSERAAKKRRVTGRSKSVSSTQSHVRPPSPALDPRNQPPPPPVDPLRDFQPESLVAAPTMEATIRAMQAQIHEMAHEIAALKAAMYPNNTGNMFAGSQFIWPAVPTVNPFAQYPAGFTAHGGDEYTQNGGYFNPQAHTSGIPGPSQQGVPDPYERIANLGQFGTHKDLQSTSPSGSVPIDWSDSGLGVGTGSTDGTAGSAGSAGGIGSSVFVTSSDAHTEPLAADIRGVGTSPVPRPHGHENKTDGNAHVDVSSTPHDTDLGKPAEAGVDMVPIVTRTDAPSGAADGLATRDHREADAETDRESDRDADGQEEPDEGSGAGHNTGRTPVKELAKLPEDADGAQDMDISA
ncbi:uncharacterized protein BXZ73DRAFT_108529 [Epithele typhae]|uniref:uncharacterized protein n=1 Tax=Epithele typhae TaxID=378194 RepID=UPI002008E727|nr:uncharacterized protein BXZ73DRAFT_108529 [Epithele typhae]KAH9910762.1 hypothetical protein BXZ73DRAFT_108529 [Epithele typhae]